jgi:hypothetical protein
MNIASRLGNHFWRHVDADDSTAWSNAACCQYAVKTCPAAKIEDGLTRTQRAQRQRIPDTTK